MVDSRRGFRALARDGAAVLIVGDVGFQLEHMPFHEREFLLWFARSYGPCLRAVVFG